MNEIVYNMLAELVEYCVSHMDDSNAIDTTINLVDPHCVINTGGIPCIYLQEVDTGDDAICDLTLAENKDVNLVIAQIITMESGAPLLKSLTGFVHREAKS